MNILLVDVESTGLDPTKDRAIEIAGVLYSVEHRCIIQQASTVANLGDTAYGAGDVHGIPEHVLTTPNVHWGAAGYIVDWFRFWDSEAAYVMAHNAKFDKAFFNQGDLLTQSTWLDSQHLPHTHYKTQPSLVELCLHYGVPVVSAHRALDDCRLLAELLGKLPDLEGAISYAAEPRITVKALIDYGRRQEAKDSGFTWDRMVKGAWAKTIRASEFTALDESLTF